MSGTLPKINPTQTTAWAALGDLFKAQKDWSMADLFLNDPDRAKISLQGGWILFGLQQEFNEP